VRQREEADVATSVGVNKLSVVNADSNGTTIAFPDVCKTPAPPAGPIPIPYPNIAQSSDADAVTKQVTVDGKGVCVKDSSFKTSTGDEAGSVGGIASSKTKGKAEFVNVSFDVKFEGKGVARSFDLMLHNDKNTPPFPVLQGPVLGLPEAPDPCDCGICGKGL
jgi:hypothetical protein